MGFNCSLDKAASRFRDIMDDLDHKLRKYMKSNEKSTKSRKSQSKHDDRSRSKDRIKSSKDRERKDIKSLKKYMFLYVF